MSIKNPHLMFDEEGIKIIKEQLDYHLTELKLARTTIKFDNKLREKYPDLNNKDVDYLRKLEQIKIEVHADKVVELSNQITQYRQHHDVAAIKARHNIRDWIGKKVELKDRGKRAVGLCPFHQEKTPSFTVYEDSYFCFGCQASGDLITWIMETDGDDFNQALTKLL